MFAPIAIFKTFLHDETGSVMAETVIVLPMLLWAFLALFVYWDSFRSLNTVQKASYTVSDIISREMKARPSTYFDGLRNVMELLIDSDQNVKMRITSITYRKVNLRFEVLWSYSPGSALPALNTTLLQDLKGLIPNMSDADYATIVETEVPYTPIFNIGMSPTTLKQFIITRPRFVAPTCLVGSVCT
jgi:hypothetical protein